MTTYKHSNLTTGEETFQGGLPWFEGQPGKINGFQQGLIQYKKWTQERRKQQTETRTSNDRWKDAKKLLKEEPLKTVPPICRTGSGDIGKWRSEVKGHGFAELSLPGDFICGDGTEMLLGEEKAGKYPKIIKFDIWERVTKLARTLLKRRDIMTTTTDSTSDIIELEDYETEMHFGKLEIKGLTIESELEKKPRIGNKSRSMFGRRTAC